MKNDKTDEFSFVIKPAQHGVGVYAAHNIKKGTYLRLFREENEERVGIERKIKDVPIKFRQYCIEMKDTLWCPKNFSRMEIGWYLNHSKNPNAMHSNYLYYALRDIKEDEEITIDYSSLEESSKIKYDY